MNIEKLKKLMEEKNINQCELAETAGVSQAFICNMLKGYKIPSVPVLVRIAKRLNVSVDELVE